MSNIKVYTVTKPYLDYECKIGESILYDTTAHVLWFVDILRGHLHYIDLKQGPSSHKVFKDLPIQPFKIVSVANHPDLIAFGGRQGYGIMPKSNPKASVYINSFWTAAEIAKGKHKKMSSNDGGVDSHGRFWVGTMVHGVPLGEMTAEGTLHRLDPDGRQQRMLSNITIPNGLSFSPKNDIMYYTDSRLQSVFSFDFNAEQGTIANKRTFFTLKARELQGGPDGNCMDAEGCLWIACFGIGKVLRVDPQGEVVAEVRLPTRCVTDVAFEGTGSMLWITTAADMIQGTLAEKANSVKMQGRLFCVDVGVNGCPLNEFKWEQIDSQPKLDAVPKL